MTTTVITVDNTGIIEICPLSPELIVRLSEMVDGPRAEKKPKARKVRIMTDEQKAAFRARMLAGRAAKALAEAEIEAILGKIDAKLDPKVEPVVAAAPVKFAAKPKQSFKVPMPRTGRKVKAKPGAQ
jgi:hypothetical protein